MAPSVVGQFLPALEHKRVLRGVGFCSVHKGRLESPEDPGRGPVPGRTLVFSSGWMQSNNYCWRSSHLGRGSNGPNGRRHNLQGGQGCEGRERMQTAEMESSRETNEGPDGQKRAWEDNEPEGPV